MLAAQRDPRHFGVLYERYYESIFRFIYKRIDDEALCADLCADVFLKAMLHLGRYRFRGVPFSAWLYRIAINEVNQYFRRHQRQRVVSFDSGQFAAMAEEVVEDLHDAWQARLLRAMQHLSIDEMQWIELRFFEQMPFKEIAAIYNITENNAKVRMHRLLKKLQKIMTPGPGNV